MKRFTGDSCSEPSLVSFLQRWLDLPHPFLHFGVRQGALGASESQGECDALMSLGNLRAMVFVKRASRFEQLTRCLVDRGQQRGGRDMLLHADREISLA